MAEPPPLDFSAFVARKRAEHVGTGAGAASAVSSYA